MSPTRHVDVELEASKRRLRAHIGRLRRQMDHRIWALRHEAAQSISWRTQVQRHPQTAMLAALGFGLALSGGLGHGRWSRFLGRQLVRRAWSMLRRRLWQECRAMWLRLVSQE